MLARVGLSDSRDAIAEVFQGMLQRVGLAQAILHDPSWCSGRTDVRLGPNGPSRGSDLIQQLRSEGKTVFFSTHILSTRSALRPRRCHSPGELRGVGAVAELTSGKQASRDCLYAPEQKVHWL